MVAVELDRAGPPPAGTVPPGAPHLVERLTVVEADALRINDWPGPRRGAGRQPAVKRGRAGLLTLHRAVPTLDRR